MKSGDRSRPLGKSGPRPLLALVFLVCFASAQPFPARAEAPPPPEPFEIQLRLARPALPPPPSPFTIQVLVSRSPAPPVPEPFSIELTVARADPIPPPAPFTIELTVSREMATPPAPFPMRVTVIREPLPPPPLPFPLRVKVVRKDPIAAPIPFPLRVTVIRRPLPPPPAPFPLRVSVVRKDLSAAPTPLPLRVTVVRPPLPPPPAPFTMRVNVVRPGIDPEVAELLAELRRLEAASAVQAQAAQESSEGIEQALRRAEDHLGQGRTELQTAVQFLDSGEQRLQGFAAIRDAVRGQEAAAKAALQPVLATSLEVCALDTGAEGEAVAPERMAGLDRQVEDAAASIGEIEAAQNRCAEGAAELRTEIGEWQSQWLTVIQGKTGAAERQIGEAGAVLIEGAAAAEELGSKAIRLGELEGEAEPLTEGIEERAGAWTSPSLAEMREEVLTEERRLAGQIGDRVEAVLESHDFQTGAIENSRNELDLVRHDLEGLARETSRVRQGLLPELTTILAETDLAAQRAAESAAQADAALSTAHGCLEGIRGRVGVEEEPLKTVPDLFGKSERFAITYLGELDLRPFLLSESTLDDNEVGTVARQAPAAGAKLLPGEMVSLWIFRAAVKPPARTSVPILTQEGCEARWPGTTLATEPGGGNPRCECPSGSAWSSVQNRCLSLVAGDGSGGSASGDRDCSRRRGTVYDPRSGRCECVLGTWVEGQGRCVDATVTERQKEIDNAQTAADCERVLVNVRMFRSHPESMQQQMAASAEQKARQLGCDESAIQSAIDEGDRRTWVTPPTGGTAEIGPIGPQVPEDRPDLQPLTRTPGEQPGGSDTQPPPGAPPDCSHCRTMGGIKEFAEYWFENRGHCKYHPARLAMYCDPDPVCVHWRKECARQKRLFDECMAACSQ